jgi:hypothetical protein
LLSEVNFQKMVAPMSSSAVSSAAKDSVAPFNLDEVFVFTGEEILEQPRLKQTTKQATKPLGIRHKKRKLAPVKINSISF